MLRTCTKIQNISNFVNHKLHTQSH